MKLTILLTGEVPRPLDRQFPGYDTMFRSMLEKAGADFDYEVVPVSAGAALPEPEACEAILITGSSAGVYDDLPWLDPLRDFIRKAYAARTRMVGVCFGHQIMADALGGAVRKSEKGWGLGRHTYRITAPSALADEIGPTLAIACAHQDQVITPPEEADVIMECDFTPNAGLLYRNGAALSVQPHPEFEDPFARALVDLCRPLAPAEVIAEATSSLEKTASDSPALARAIVAFLDDRPSASL